MTKKPILTKIPNNLEFQEYLGKEIRIVVKSGAIYEGWLRAVRGETFCLTGLRIINWAHGETSPKGEWKKGKHRASLRWFKVSNVKSVNFIRGS
jgi:hypothetical protein